MKLVLTFAVGLVVGCTLAPGASAQTPEGLDIPVYAGLSITGAVGTVYSIQYVPDLAQTNNPSAWRCLEFLQLPASPYLWVDKSAPPAGKPYYWAVKFSAPTNLVFIPPGTFRMGSPTNEVDRHGSEAPQTAVIISRGFWMSECEVTQREYLLVMGSNPSWFNGDRTSDGGAYYGTNLSRPVEQASWDDAIDYCNKLTRQQLAAGRIPTGSLYRLPTAAEWQYACRAWTSTRFSFGDDPGYTSLSDFAWYGDNSGGTTHPVGQKLPNPWGLHDMHGNAWEWCQDWYPGSWPYLFGGILLDPQGAVTGTSRMVGGGAYIYPGDECRSAVLNNYPQDERTSQIGFRVVLATSQPQPTWFGQEPILKTEKPNPAVHRTAARRLRP